MQKSPGSRPNLGFVFRSVIRTANICSDITYPIACQLGLLLGSHPQLNTFLLKRKNVDDHLSDKSDLFHAKELFAKRTAHNTSPRVIRNSILGMSGITVSSVYQSVKFGNLFKGLAAV